MTMDNCEPIELAASEHKNMCLKKYLFISAYNYDLRLPS